jgi:predicted Rdx family selenoprotein
MPRVTFSSTLFIQVKSAEAFSYSFFLQFAQELLSTFSNSLGEVALIPATGGVFTVDLTHTLPLSQLHGNEETAIGEARSYVRTTRLWDRKAQGGFPGMYNRLICHFF